jgi:hypothetical protein
LGSTNSNEVGIGDFPFANLGRNRGSPMILRPFWEEMISISQVEPLLGVEKTKMLGKFP